MTFWHFTITDTSLYYLWKKKNSCRCKHMRMWASDIEIKNCTFQFNLLVMCHFHFKRRHQLFDKRLISRHTTRISAVQCYNTAMKRICDQIASQLFPLWCKQIVEKHADPAHETGELCRALALDDSGRARRICLICRPAGVTQLWFTGGCLRWGCRGGYVGCSSVFGSSTVIVSVGHVMLREKWLRSFRLIET